MKTFNSIFLFLLILSAFFLTNCYVSPAPIMQLTPEHINLEWFKGKQISTLTNGHVSILLSFDRTENNNYLFDVEIFNNSENIILVNPELFYFTTLESTNKKRDSLLITNAFDPEKAILDIQKANSLHQSNVETQNMFNVFGNFLLLASQTKAIITNDTYLTEEVNKRAQEMKEERLLDDVRNERIERSLSSSKYLWETLALRKTTLKKDQSIKGKVFFPLDKYAQKIKLFFPIGNYKLNIIFVQKVYFK